VGDGRGNEGHGAPGDIEQRAVLLAAVFIDVTVDAILALAVRLKVVASLKVTPSAEFACVCSTSPWKMSSCRRSGADALLRVTVALPVSVATLPIGSASAEGAGEGAAAGAGACAGWVCASRFRPDLASDIGAACSVPKGGAIALA
jgi:hypothetical protein